MECVKTCARRNVERIPSPLHSDSLTADRFTLTGTAKWNRTSHPPWDFTIHQMNTRQNICKKWSYVGGLQSLLRNHGIQLALGKIPDTFGRIHGLHNHPVTISIMKTADMLHMRETRHNLAGRLIIPVPPPIIPWRTSGGRFGTFEWLHIWLHNTQARLRQAYPITCNSVMTVPNSNEATTSKKFFGILPSFMMSPDIFAKLQHGKSKTWRGQLHERWSVHKLIRRVIRGEASLSLCMNKSYR